MQDASSLIACRIQLWFDPEIQGYRIFMPDGSEIPFVAKVRILEYFPEKGASAVITFPLIDIINEKPCKHQEQMSEKEMDLS